MKHRHERLHVLIILPYAGASSISVISAGAPTRSGGPQKPVPFET